MVDPSRGDFNAAAALTMEVRIKALPAQDQEQIKSVQQEHEAQKSQLAIEQAQKRQEDIEKEKQRLLQERPTHDLRPPEMQDSWQQFTNRSEKQAENNVDFANSQEMSKIDEQKEKEVERRVERAEKTQEREREQKRADDLDRAAQRARELQEQKDRDQSLDQNRKK